MILSRYSATGIVLPTGFSTFADYGSYLWQCRVFRYMTGSVANLDSLNQIRTQAYLWIRIPDPDPVQKLCWSHTETILSWKKVKYRCGTVFINKIKVYWRNLASSRDRAMWRGADKKNPRNCSRCKIVLKIYCRRPEQSFRSLRISLSLRLTLFLWRSSCTGFLIFPVFRFSGYYMPFIFFPF